MLLEARKLEGGIELGILVDRKVNHSGVILLDLIKIVLLHGLRLRYVHEVVSKSLDGLLVLLLGLLNCAFLSFSVIIRLKLILSQFLVSRYLEHLLYSSIFVHVLRTSYSFDAILPLELLSHPLPLVLLLLDQQINECVVLVPIPMVEYLHELVLSHLLSDSILVGFIDLESALLSLLLESIRLFIPLSQVIVSIGENPPLLLPVMLLFGPLKQVSFIHRCLLIFQHKAAFMLSLHFLCLMKAVNGIFSEALIGNFEDALLLQVISVPLIVLELVFELLVVRIVCILPF